MTMSPDLDSALVALVWILVVRYGVSLAIYLFNLFVLTFMRP